VDFLASSELIVIDIVQFVWSYLRTGRKVIQFRLARAYH